MSDLSLSALERINDVCDGFAKAWQGGRRPRVAEFLADAPEDERPALRRELLPEAVFYLKADQRRRWGQGERALVAGYLREGPALGEGPERVLGLVAHEVALRRQALDWLRADLALWAKQAGSAKAEDRAAAQQALRHWQQDADLASVRGQEALVALPAEERAEWDKLWAEVADLLRQLDAAKPAAAPAGK
jgi:hypothetical protein